MAVWLTSYGKLKDAVAMIQENPQVDRILSELESLNIAPYRQVLSGMNRVIYEQRGDTAYIHIVGDTRQYLQWLFMERIVNS
jgi:toxin ParE1/3/4